jgi:glycosyltransferase involved in cell wall biosynthesis
MRARLSARLSPARQRAESDARRLAIGQARQRGLVEMLARDLPKGTSYLNVGLSNLSERNLEALRKAGLTVAVMIHDTIPLDFPQYQGRGGAERFARRLTATAAHGHCIIYNSLQTRTDVERHLRSAMARLPEPIVAHLGVDPVKPDTAQLPPAARDPYFVVLGTIEPRKNHRLLLDIWEEMAAELPPGADPAQVLPQLLVVGNRGWRNEDVFDWLDSSPLSGRVVHELRGLDDGAVSALLQGARALLFPSHAEGFGLPLAEAAALGCPVIAAPLPVFREIADDYPVYVPVDDRYRWRNEILAHAGPVPDRQAAQRNGFVPPRWSDHFDTVFARI